MTSEQTPEPTNEHRGRTLMRRAVALVSMLTLAVPVLLTTLAAPAGATTTFDVPGLIANSAIGYATNYTVNGSVTLSATGGWTENTASCPALNCRGPNGTGAPLAGENQANWLLPGGSAFILAGRIGTSGPWTAVGSGPVTMHGNGALYMAMNDRLPSYADNGGSMHVTATDPLQLTTTYLSDGPVLAGTPVDWQGTLANTNTTNVADVQATVSLGAPATDEVTWGIPDTENGGVCTPSEEGGLYFCDIGTVPAGSSAVIDGTADTTGLQPGTISDSLQVSTDGGNSFTAAPVAQQQIDGLQFDVLAPPTIPDGKVLQLTTTVTNTSATDTISDIFLHGSIDRSTYHSGPPDCAVDNGGEGGSTIDCPNEEGGYTLSPGESLDFTTTVNTNGLAGENIDWSMFADSPDLNGDTQTESGSVGVVADTGAAAPTVSIVSPANNAKLGQTLAHVFHANATPASGQSIDYVDLQIDSGMRTIKTSPPYSVTIAANQLSPGTHFLKATAHDSDGQATLVANAVTVAAPPSVNIVPPAGFTQLDTATTFRSTATPGTGAPGVTIVSVAYAIDGNSIGSTTTAPYTKVLDPSVLSLSSGSHTLTAIALDSTGQTATDDFPFSVPGASLQIAATSPPVIGQITTNGDAAWPVQVTNTSNVVAHHVKLTIDATATAPNASTTALTYDLGAINGGLNLPATTVTCVPGSGSTFVCDLPDIPPMSSLASPYRIFVTTPGVVTGSTITGHAVASAANAGPASGDLGAVSVISCGTSCVIGVAAPGDPFASTPAAPTTENPTKQVITLTSGVAGGPALPAVTVTLSSINPTAATDPTDALLCPIGPGTVHCSGQISSVVAHFGDYVDKKNPIRVTIIARWGTSIPAGHILMEKNTGGDPIFLVPCVVNPTTREFNTPCVLPEIVHGTAAAGNLTTYDSVLFVGDDVHFARRIIANVNPPGAPTGVVATSGVGKATVKWAKPRATNGANVVGYEVTALSGGVVQKIVDFDSTALTQTITGLTAGKTYTFKVAAANIAGLGVASAVSNAIKPIGPPAAPTGVTAAAGVGKATLRWTAPTVTGGSAITGYVVTVLVAGVVQKTVTFTTAALTEAITGLTRGKSYTFKVAAKNVAGIGGASALSNAVTPT